MRYYHRNSFLFLCGVMLVAGLLYGWCAVSRKGRISLEDDREDTHDLTLYNLEWYSHAGRIDRFDAYLEKLALICALVAPALVGKAGIPFTLFGVGVGIGGSGAWAARQFAERVAGHTSSLLNDRAAIRAYYGVEDIGLSKADEDA